MGLGTFIFSDIYM